MVSGIILGNINIRSKGESNDNRKNIQLKKMSITDMKLRECRKKPGDYI